MQETIKEYILRNELIAGGRVIRVSVTQGSKTKVVNRDELMVQYGCKPITEYRLTPYYE